LGTLESHNEIEATGFAAMEDRRLILMDHAKEVASVQRLSLVSALHMRAFGGLTHKVIADERRIWTPPAFKCDLIGMNREEANVDGLTPIHFD